MRVDDLNEYGLTPGAPTPVGQQTHATTAHAATATPVLQPGNTPGGTPKTAAPAQSSDQKKKPTIAKAKELEADFEFPDKDGNVVKVITPSSNNKNKEVVVQNQKTKAFYTLDPEDNVLLPQVQLEEDPFKNSLKRITGKRGKKLKTVRSGHRHLQLGRSMKKMKKLARGKRLGSNPIFEITVDDPTVRDEILNQPINCSFEVEFIWHGLPGAENYDVDVAQRAVAEEINDWIVSNSLVTAVKAGEYYQGDVESEQNFWRIEDDPSVVSNVGIPSEIISPMFATPATMLSELNNLLEYFKESKAETNNTTDLHVTMSWTRDTVPVDKLKMGLLLGDRYFLQQFENEDPNKIKKVEQILAALSRNINNPNALHALEKVLSNVAQTEKFSTAYFRGEENDLNNQLVEFRIVSGDDYHLNFGRITTLVTKYAAIMTAGHDNTKYNQEYIAAVDAAIHGIRKVEPVVPKKAIAPPKKPGTFDDFNGKSLREQLDMLNSISDSRVDEAWEMHELHARIEKKDQLVVTETLKKVKGKWALVSKSNPSKVLQYYDGPKGQRPSKEWVAKVERRVHAFEGAVPDNATVRQIKKILATPLRGDDLKGQMAAYVAVPDPSMVKAFRDAISVGGKNYDLRNIFKGFIRNSVHPEIIKQLNL